MIDNYRGVLPLEDLGLVYKSVKLVLGATEEEQEVSNGVTSSYHISYIIYHIPSILTRHSEGAGDG